MRILVLLMALLSCSACATLTPTPTLHQTLPVEDLEPLETITVLDLKDPRAVKGVSNETIQAIQRNHHRMYVWGLKNQITLKKANEHD